MFNTYVTHTHYHRCGPTPYEKWVQEENQKLLTTYYRPSPIPRYSILDHGPFDLREDICLSCGKSKVKLYSSTRMEKCV